MADPDFASIQSSIAASSYQDQYSVAATPLHTHNSVDSTPLDYTNLTNRTRFIVYRLLAPTDAVSVANTVGGYFSMPFAGGFGIPDSIGGYLTDALGGVNAPPAVFASVDTAGTTGATIIDMRISRVTGSSSDVFGGTVAIGIASGSLTSLLSAAQPLFVIPTFNIGDRLSFNVASVSSSAPLGLTIYLRVTETSQ